MAGVTRNLSLMLLPQRWDGTQLVANLLLLPNGDPTAAVTLVPPTAGTELAFAAAQPVLRAALLPGLATPPWDNSITPAMLTTVPLALPYSDSQGAIFSALSAEYTPTVPMAVQAAGVIRKDLPLSYLQATGFQTPDAELFTAIDGFGCALGASTPDTTPIAGPFTIAWGEILSYALRQPLIAQAMGLMYLQVSIPFTAAQVLNGGWIWLEIDTTEATNWYAKLVGQNKSAVVSYAARLPALSTAQDVFAAILFPTVFANYDASILDTAQFEADLYLDGFAKVVHANQPTSTDTVTNDPDTIVPGTDAGVQIGWDDEQVTTWVNRQITIAQELASATPPATPTAELPFTVLGYRVDVRQKTTDPWASLCAASGTLNAAGVFTTSFAAQDLCVEPTPIQNAGTGQDYWLPQYFAHWRGRTLVVNDPYAYAFSGGQPPVASGGPAPSDFNGTTTESLSGVSLRYGQRYQFRTRLSDLTGGGPQTSDVAPADAGITTVNFRRHVPPKKVKLTLGDVDGSGNQALTVERPGINYPEMVFAGAADQATLDALLAITPAQPPAGTPADPNAPSFQASLLDPDVTMLEIIVEAQSPVNDTGAQCSLADADTPPNPNDLDGVFRVVYTWQVPFDALATPVALDAASPIQLTLQPTAMNQIDDPVLPTSANPTLLPIPTGRNVRLRLRGLGTPDLNDTYFANSISRTGLIADLRVRYEAATETGLLVAGNADDQLQAFYLRNLDQTAQQDVVLIGLIAALEGAPGITGQGVTNLVSTLQTPASTPLQLLASALNLPLSGETLSAPPGQRILFGAQSTLRHNVPQDRSSISFATQKDLIDHWIVVTRVTLDRDWTWSGLAQQGAGQKAFTIYGPTSHDGSSAPVVQALGKIDLPGVVSTLATQQGSLDNQRDGTELIFFSTLNSTVGLNGFPAPTSASYHLTATLTGAPTSEVPVWNSSITVPITDNPRQVPQIVSAGIAESEYVAADDYSSTTQRQRALWFELDQPPLDPNDSYFIRVMNYGPDPLLISHPFDLPAGTDSPIPLDPEPIRKITPDSANDDAGLAAMQQMIPSGVPPSASSVHYMVPLPGSISPAALDLFGFWTYELRCGHMKWATAQGRFGRPLRVAGVQHPCPPLVATVERIATDFPATPDKTNIVATADLAQTVLNGVSLTTRNAPQTQIWFLLYAQVRRADGQAYRNVLLRQMMGTPPPVDPATGLPLTGIPAQLFTVSASFLQSQVDTLLGELLLPFNTPLSVLAVELFNQEDLVIPESQFGAPAVSAKTTAGASAVATMESEPGGASARAAAPQAEAINDPLGSQLGSQRILRTSPLTPVGPIC